MSHNVDAIDTFIASASFMYRLLGFMSKVSRMLGLAVTCAEASKVSSSV